MPLYDFRCLGADHHEFEKMLPINERDDAVGCPSCGSIATRVIKGAPRMMWFPGSTREYTEKKKRRPE